MLHVENLNAFYGDAQTIFVADLEVHPGEVVALLGRNGCGKSTLLRAILGMVDSRGGKITFKGHDITGMETYKIARLGLGYVPESRRIFTNLTVRENLLTGKRGGHGGKQVWDEARIYKLFPSLLELQDRNSARISGGEQQMLTIARTLMGNPDAILLDEPSEGLAPRIVEMIIEIVNALKQQGIAIIVSEQNMRFASLVADRAYILESGHIRHHAPIADIVTDQELLVKYLSA